MIKRKLLSKPEIIAEVKEHMLPSALAASCTIRPLGPSAPPTTGCEGKVEVTPA